MDDIRTSEWFLLMVMMIHLIMAPFTKVEESFNTQALHDILFHGVDLSQYDHLEFPGVVPRTFTGPLALANVLYPVKVVLYDWMEWGGDKYWMLFIARFTLGFIVLLTLGNFSRCVEKHFHSRVMGSALRLLIASQFHFIYYASRTLPNTFALPLVLFSLQKLLDKQYSYATMLATVATFLFRFELVLLYGPIYLLLFIFARRRVSFFKTVGVGLATLLVTLAITVPLDSYFWRLWPLWPEGEVIFFNLWENRSAEYGVMPFWWYFKSALPRALLTSIALIPLGFLVSVKRRLLLGLFVPAGCFVLVYSFLPHKELRFILYAIPLLNLPAARFLSWVWERRKESALRRMIAYGVSASLLANILCSALFLYASARNYPGGDGLSHLQFVYRFIRNKHISVHIDVFCAENGVNRFLHLYPKWEYNKTERLSGKQLSRFDYILIGSSSPKQLDAKIREVDNSHKEHFSVEAFHRLELKKWWDWKPGAMAKGWKVPIYYPRMELKRKVVVMKKRD